MQSRSSWWLMGMGVVILVVVVASVAVALVNRSRAVALLPEDTAEGTVQRYLLAIQEEDPRAAYDYLSPDLQERCEFQHFWDSTRYLSRGNNGNSRDLRVTLEGAKPVDAKTEVRVRITEFNVSPPFDVNEYSHIESFLLERQDGSWRFLEPPWPMNWCPEPKPAPTPPVGG